MQWRRGRPTNTLHFMLFFTRKCQVLVLNFTLAPDANSAGSREERLVRCIGDVIQELLAAHENGRDVNLVT